LRCLGSKCACPPPRGRLSDRLLIADASAYLAPFGRPTMMLAVFRHSLTIFNVGPAMTKAGENLEQAERFYHDSLTLFDRRVAMSMAMIAAILAFVSMLRDKAGNDMIRLQVRAHSLSIQSNGDLMRASDQAILSRQLGINRRRTEDFLTSLALTLPVDSLAAERTRAEHEHHDQLEQITKETAESEQRTADLIRHAAELASKSQSLKEQSDHDAERNEWLERLQLVVEVALVLCSIAILTKQKGYWIAGGLAAAVGFVGALLTLLH
jgi:Domain of unknown function (DUF4337)